MDFKKLDGNYSYVFALQGRFFLNKQYDLRKSRIDEITKEKTNDILDPITIALMCLEMEENENMNITIEELIVILFNKKKYGNDLFGDDGINLIKNINILPKEELQKKYKEITDTAKQIKIYEKYWFDNSIQPNDKLFNYNLFLFMMFLTIKKLFFLRLNGDTKDYTPQIIPTNNTLTEEELYRLGVMIALNS